MTSSKTTGFNALNGDLLKWLFRGMLVLIFICLGGLYAFVHAVEQESKDERAIIRESLAEIKVKLEVLDKRAERIENLLQRERGNTHDKRKNGSD